MPTEQSLKHIIFLTMPSWGHLRPSIKFSLQLAEKFPNLFVSVFIYGPKLTQAQEYFQSLTSPHTKRIRLVPSAESTGPAVAAPNAIQMFAILQDSFQSWIAAQLKTHATEIQGMLVGRPSWVIEDLFGGGMSLGCGLPVVVWWLGTAASLISHVGNEENGHGSRIFELMAERQAKGEAIGPENATEVFLKELSDRLVCVPGLPALYEHELYPHLMPFIPAFTTFLIPRWINFIKSIEHVVCCTAFEMEPISSAALASALPKPITPFFVGPAVDLPPTPTSGSTTSPVTEFLDRAYTDLGPHSVVYIAFGSLFFPLPESLFFPLPESLGHLRIIVEEILASGSRIVFSLPKTSGVDQAWVDGLAQSGRAIFPEWTEQTRVLEHPAIHYFLSHGGWNSTTEAIVRGVPMIFWPFVGDQPTDALQIGMVHDCGFELLQVRTGPARKIACRAGANVVIHGMDDTVREEIQYVLKEGKGARGKLQRMNASMLGKVLAESVCVNADLEKMGKALGLGA